VAAAVDCHEIGAKLTSGGVSGGWIGAASDSAFMGKISNPLLAGDSTFLSCRKSTFVDTVWNGSHHGF